MDCKVAVVSGSSSGIGLLTTIELARAGFYVIATMREPARRTRLDEKTPADLKDKIEVRRLDITEFGSIPAAVAGIARDHGRIDLLVNNAGFAVGGFAEDVKLEELRSQFDTNFFGHVAMSKAVFPIMRKQGSGSIIMISSLLGLIGQPVVSSYCASKFALEGWTEAARIEMQPVGIKLVLVEPGAYETDIWERNVLVSEGSLSPDSPNKERSRRFAEGMEGRQKKGDAVAVARLVTQIAQNSSPKLRYRIGRDANLGYWLSRMLPWNTWEKMMAKRSSIH